MLLRMVWNHTRTYRIQHPRVGTAEVVSCTDRVEDGDVHHLALRRQVLHVHNL